MKKSTVNSVIRKGRLGERAGVRGNPAMNHRGITQNKIQEEDDVKLPWLPLIVLIMAMVFVGANAFGDVNQFEIEAGLTVEAVTFHNTFVEKTVEVTVGYFELLPFTEYAVANIGMNQIVEIEVSASTIPSGYFRGSFQADAFWGMIDKTVGVRIFGPLLNGREAVNRI